VLEGSQDGKTWEVLDSREDNFDLVGSGQVATFEVQTASPLRMIRLRQTGLTHRGDDYLYFAGLEVFGVLHHMDPALSREEEDEWSEQDDYG
jgi:hypothetical protein